MTTTNAARTCPLWGMQAVALPGPTPRGLVQAGMQNVDIRIIDHPCAKEGCVFWGQALDPEDRNGEVVESDGCVILQAVRTYILKS